MEQQAQTMQELIAQIESAVLSELEKQIEQNAPCPHCAVDQILERNETLLMADLFRVGKGSPKETARALAIELLEAQTITILLQKILVTYGELFTEELNSL